MTVIIGGAYQGKCTYAREKYGLSESDISVCEGETFDPAARAIAHLERFSLAVTERGGEPVDVLREKCPDLADKILISDDISCGVVPTDALQRAWREAHGRMMNTLSREADGVVRLFCGLPQVLK